MPVEGTDDPALTHQPVGQGPATVGATRLDAEDLSRPGPNDRYFLISDQEHASLPQWNSLDRTEVPRGRSGFWMTCGHADAHGARVVANCKGCAGEDASSQGSA
jgi:hypothetical protein